jgi:hypothetical protein
MKLLDTCFLIDLQKEWIGGQPGPATDYLSARSQEEFAISVVTVLESWRATNKHRMASDFCPRSVNWKWPARRLGSGPVSGDGYASKAN